MAVFAVHVVVPRGYEYAQFAPGDVVPEWAVGLVGDHCLTEVVEPAGVDDVPAVAPVVEPAGVDFTKPAGRGQGRKR